MDHWRSLLHADEATALRSLRRRALAGLRVEGEWNGTPHLIWQRAKDRRGYGVIWDARRGNNSRITRVMWELFTGEPLPDDLVPDHLCRTPPCAALDHLDPVATQVNIERGEVGRWQRDKTRCPRGHAYDAAHTRTLLNADGSYRGRWCRACDREDKRARARGERYRTVDGRRRRQ